MQNNSLHHRLGQNAQALDPPAPLSPGRGSDVSAAMAALAAAPSATPPLRWREWRCRPMLRESVERVMDATPLKGYTGNASRLRRATALCLGLGAVGGPAIEQLARAGVGEIIAVDPDDYGEESFLTQPIFWREGTQPKAWVQAARAHKGNPSGIIRAAIGHAQDLPLRILRRASVLVVAGDNLELPLWACRMAAALGKPVVHAAVHGETASAIVRGYALGDPAAACARCGLGLRELAAQKSRHGCDPSTLREAGAEPTRTMPVICNVAGQLAANETLKWITGSEHVLQGEEYAFSLETCRAWRTERPRNAGCELPHQRWQTVDLAEPLDTVSPSSLAARLGVAGGPGLLQVRSEVPWISFAICPVCCRQTTVRRFARLGSEVGRCDCGQPLPAGPQGARSVVPLADLQACWDCSFADLGLLDCEAVGMMAEDEWFYFFPPDDEARPLCAGPSFLLENQ